MKVHAYTRNKHMVDFLHASGLCVDYSRFLSIETHSCTGDNSKFEETGGVLVPPDDQSKALYLFNILSEGPGGPLAC